MRALLPIPLQILQIRAQTYDRQGFSGGGIANYSGKLTLINSTVSNNSADRFGGGIIGNSSDTTLDITNSTVSGNSAAYGGGGIVNNGTLSLTNSTVSGNSADGPSGGIFNAGTLTLTNSTVSGNAATDSGGGIANFFGALTLTNSTVSGNAAYFGGGSYNHAATLTLLNSTISDNSAVYGAGGIEADSGHLTLENSIVANSSGAGEIHITASVTITGSHNLVEDGSDGLPDTVTGDPLLGPLQNNGGPTLTHALLAGSPAIDSGDDTLAAGLTTDQRGPGFPRIQGAHVDIGSYEAPEESLVVTTLADEDDGTSDPTVGRAPACARRWPTPTASPAPTPSPSPPA